MSLFDQLTGQEKADFRYARHRGWSQKDIEEAVGRGNLSVNVARALMESPYDSAQKVPAREAAEKRLRHAWDELNKAEMEKVVPKAIEYGSGDLKLMGYALKQLLNSPRARARNWTEAESMEIAIAFYTLGKVARELSAFEMGNMPSEDQPHDIGVYQRMVQIIRKEGSWPPGFEDYLKEKE